MPQMTGDFQAALFTDFEEMYNEWFFAAQNVNDFTKFCDVINATTLTTNLNFMETIPQFSEWLDERKLQSIGPAYNYSVAARHWEVTIEIDRDTLDDDRLQLERQKIAHLGLEAGRAPWQLFINALVANGTGYDTVAMFSTAHTQNGQANQSNIVTGSGTSIANIMADIATVKANFRLVKDGQGRPMNLGSTGLHILAPPAMEQQLNQIANNDFVVVNVSSGIFGQESNYLKGMFDFTIDPYLTDTDDWYAFDTGQPAKPFIYINRKAPEFTSLDAPTSPENWMRRKLMYGADWRSAIGYGPWYLAQQVAQD